MEKEEVKYYYYYQTNEEKEAFESGLSSMVSSPSTQVMIGGGNNNDHGMMMELIGRLGCISDSNNITHQQISCINTTTTTNNNSTNTSCYTTPLNSPPYNLISGGAGGGGVNLPNCHPAGLLPLDADPEFVERAARFSSFGGGGGSGVNLESGNFGKVSTPENGDVGDSRQGSSVSDQNPVAQMGLIDVHSRKRKSFCNSNVQDYQDNKVEQENEKANAKRSKPNGEEVKKQNGGECNAITTTNSNSNNNNNDSNNNKEKQNNSKEVAKAEPPKDYIHVRARRGQATDSHSLAERVRREKISERMKFLQDLVPGCNKVTGKAIVLDEIINYVQSLQRQVEFLSMKLTTFNPRTEFNPESLMSKDVFQTKGLSTMPQIMYHLEQNYAQPFPHGYQPFQQMHSPLANVAPNGNENPFSSNPSNVAGIRRHLAAQLPSSVTQVPNFWEDDLQSIVQMGIIQNQTQSVPGTSTNAQMKIEQ